MAASTSTSDGQGTSAATAPPPARSRRRSPGPACQAYSTTSHPGPCSSRMRGASMLVVTTTAPARVTTMSATPVAEAWSTRLSAPPLYQAKFSGRRSTTAPSPAFSRTARTWSWRATGPDPSAIAGSLGCGAGLGGDGGRRGGDGGRVAEGPLQRREVGDGTEVVIEVVAQRDAGREVEGGDVGVGDPVEVLHEGPEAVAVGRHQHDVARREVGHGTVVEPGQRPGHDVLQALGGRGVLRREVGPGRVTVGVVGVVGPDRRGLDVV